MQRKVKKKMVLVLQFLDGNIYRVYDTIKSFSYDFPNLDPDYIRYHIQEQPYYHFKALADTLEESTSYLSLKLSKRMVY